jgi:hypothetical protein
MGQNYMSGLKMKGQPNEAAGYSSHDRATCGKIGCMPCTFRPSPKKEKSVDKTEFKVGDIVEAFGVRGGVHTICRDEPKVCVKFDVSGGYVYFCSSGHLEPWHKEPSLKLIERPRKTKKVKVWVNVYADKHTSLHGYFHASKQDAETATRCSERHAVTQEIEVEVLDE